MSTVKAGTADARQRPWTREGTLIRGLPVARLDQLQALCGGRLARRLIDLSRWPRAGCGRTWVVSDRSYLIVSFPTASGAEGYVQFLSSPLERSVLWEVASGQYDGDGGPLVAGDRAELLLARGFALGPRPANFRREVTIDGEDAARRIAADTLSILFDTFEYRGPEPVRYRLVADRAARPRVVHTRLGVRELAFLIGAFGFTVMRVGEDRSGPAVVRARSQSLVFEAGLQAPVGRRSQRTRLVLSTCFVPHPAATWEAANAFNAECGPARAILLDGRLHLRLVLPLSFGVTEEQLRATVSAFADNMHQLDAIVVSRRHVGELAALTLN